MQTGDQAEHPEVEVEALVRAIHASPLRFVLAVTGGGSRAIGELLSVPGGSRTVLEAAVPYSAEALTAWLGSRPEHFCDERTARLMAMSAYQRAQRYVSAECDAERWSIVIAGVGCTSSLASDRPKRGQHRLHLGLQTSDATMIHSLVLEKGARPRLAEEQLAAELVLNLIAEAAGVSSRLAVALRAGETLQTARTNAPKAWQALLHGRARGVRHETGQAQPVLCEAVAGLAIFPGAFHPLHQGHRRMANIAASMLGRPIEYEISIENVDKPPLDYTEMQARAVQFDDAAVWLTRAATFEEKSQLFPAATFVVGVDTIERIDDPRYYGGSAQQRDASLRAIVERGCRFLVFGRGDEKRGFRSLREVRLSDILGGACREVDEAAFRADISSTELRRAAAGAESLEN